MDKQKTLCLKAVSLIFQYTQVLLIRLPQVEAGVHYLLQQSNIASLHFVKEKPGQYLKQ